LHCNLHGMCCMPKPLFLYLLLSSPSIPKVSCIELYKRKLTHIMRIILEAQTTKFHAQQKLIWLHTPFLTPQSCMVQSF
jgi:hypothetical protein